MTGSKRRLAVQRAVEASTATAGTLDPDALAGVLEGVVWRLERDHPSRCEELRGKLMDQLSSRRHGTREMAGTTERARLQVMSTWLASLVRALGAVTVALPRQVLPRLLALANTGPGWLKFCRETGAYVGQKGWNAAKTWAQSSSLSSIVAGNKGGRPAPLNRGCPAEAPASVRAGEQRDQPIAGDSC